MNGENRLELVNPLPQIDWEAVSDYFWGDRKIVGQIAEETTKEQPRQED